MPLTVIIIVIQLAAQCDECISGVPTETSRPPAEARRAVANWHEGDLYMADLPSISPGSDSEADDVQVIGKSRAPDHVLHGGMVVLYRERDRDESKPTPVDGDWIGLALKLRLTKTEAGLRATKAGLDDPDVLAAISGDDQAPPVIPNLQWIQMGKKGGDLASLTAAAGKMNLGEVVTVGSRALYLSPLVDPSGKHKGKCRIDDDVTVDIRLVALRRAAPPASSLPALSRVSPRYPDVTLPTAGEPASSCPVSLLQATAPCTNQPQVESILENVSQLEVARRTRGEGRDYFKAGDLVRAGQLFHEALAFAESARLRAKGLTSDLGSSNEISSSLAAGAAREDNISAHEGENGKRASPEAVAQDQSTAGGPASSAAGSETPPLGDAFICECTEEVGTLWSNLSLLCLRRGKPMQAESNASRAIGYAGPHRPKAFYRRALARRDLGKEDDAVQDARDGLAASDAPEQREALQGLIDGIIGRQVSEQRRRRAMARRMMGTDRKTADAARQGKRRKGLYEDVYGPPPAAWSLDWCSEKVDWIVSRAYSGLEYVLCCGCCR